MRDEENFLRLLNPLLDAYLYVDLYESLAIIWAKILKHDHDYQRLQYFTSEQYILIMYIDAAFIFHLFLQKQYEIINGHLLVFQF
jgi:hypothetical protein